MVVVVYAIGANTDGINGMRSIGTYGDWNLMLTRLSDWHDWIGFGLMKVSVRITSQNWRSIISAKNGGTGNFGFGYERHGIIISGKLKNECESY